RINKMGKTELTEQNSSSKNLELANQNPPLAPLVLRIGVTGHRTEPVIMPTRKKRKRPIPDIPAIRASIHEVLEVIRASCKDVADTNGDLFDLTPGNYSQPGGGTLRIISALASGADQWVAEEAISLGFELQSVLPFSHEEYLKDFTVPSEAESYKSLLEKSSAVLELDGKIGKDKNGKRKPDSQSYEAVGRGILNQTDLLIAVWDGEVAQGRGGTGQVVKEALQNGIPVIWIPWATPEKWQMKQSIWRILEEPADLTGDSDRLSEMIRNLLLPPVEEHQSDAESGKSLRTEYFAEGQKTGNPHLGIWMLFRTIICGELFKKDAFGNIKDAFIVKNFEVDEEKKVKKLWNKKVTNDKWNPIIDEEKQEWINKRFTNHYAWANGLSMFYGDMHRSAFLIVFFLGAIAVFLALASIALGISGTHQTGWITSELFVIIVIIALTYRGRNRKWHKRWIDYRTLAEHLRLSRCLILFGGGSQQVVYEAHLSTYGNPAHTWMNWHYRAIERAAGLPNLVFDEKYLDSCKEIWRDGLIKSQIRYHHNAKLRFGKMSKRLHIAGDFLFVATLIACIFHLAHLWVEHDPQFSWIPENAGNWMTVLCAFLPALGAAFAAIRSYSEAQRLAQRSKAMDDTLTQFQVEFAVLPVAGESLNSVKLRSHANRVTDLMTNEMLDWRVVFQNRPLALP
ncbi:MAG: DUF4231 domain-containing protein, partial [Draconibacterium sp.]|nr:DUF4231 domain-containing protein [Draconibacterium sp.]